MCYLNIALFFCCVFVTCTFCTGYVCLFVLFVARANLSWGPTTSVQFILIVWLLPVESDEKSHRLFSKKQNSPANCKKLSIQHNITDHDYMYMKHTPLPFYTPTTKCGGGGYTGFALSRRSVGRSVRPSVSNSCPLYNSFTYGRMSFKLEWHIHLN